MKCIMHTAVLIAALAFAAGCTWMTGQTAGKTIDDATITTKVNAAIVQEPDAHYWN